MSAKPSASRLRALSGVWVIVPAAGTGERLPGDRPKQYRDLLGRPIIDHTLSRLMVSLRPAGIVVPLAAGDAYWAQTDASSRRSQIHPIKGGASRAASVLAALDWLAERTADAVEVLVHDAVRPCVSQSEIFRLTNEPAGSDGALLAVRVRDTLKRVVDSRAVSTIDREQVWQALTPQYFQAAALRQAIRAAIEQEAGVTDESGAMELAGCKPRVVEGDVTNIKITRPGDLAIAAAILRSQA